MKTEAKVIIALVVLAGLALGLYFTRKSSADHLAKHSVVAASADLPAVGVPKDDTDKVTKIEIKNADKGNVTLEKKGDAWEVVAPVQAKANAANVKSLLENLRDLKIKDVIDRGATKYADYELDDAKGVHVVAYKGAEKATDHYFGKSGSRGQMARIAGKDGVYVTGGYSSYLYTREVKNWRETSIVKFEDANAVGVEVTNKNGQFSFSKNDEKWSGSFTPRTKKGGLDKEPAKKWEKLEESKVKDLLRAYKALNAEDFADEKADTGLANAEPEGGVVKIKLKDGAGDVVIKVGKTAKASSRYAIKEGGDPTVYVLSAWSADWAVADKAKFEKGDDKKKDAEDPHGGGHDMPEMPMMPGMPGME